MAIHVTCPGCGCTVAAPDDAAGKVARCAGCREIITVPAPEPLFTEASAEWLDDEPEPRSVRPLAEPVARRRRPRARPVSQPRTRWVFWLVGGIVAVVFLGGGAVGFAVWKLSRTDWQTHEPPGGGFRVDLPAPPRDLTKFAAVTPDPRVNTFGTVRFFAGEEYGVIWVDFEPWRRQVSTDESLLDDAVRELVKEGSGVQKLSDRTLMQNEFPAREVVLRGGTINGTAVFRVVVAESRLYMVIVGGKSLRPEDPNAQRFLNSFAITDPHLLAARDRKRGPAAQVNPWRGANGD